MKPTKILVITALLLGLTACGVPEAVPATTAAPTTEGTTVVTTEPTTAPTTEAATEPATEPTTEPVTEPVTEPTQARGETEPTEFVPPVMEGAVPESDRVDGSWFDDAVFVGDSISLKLSYYEAAMDVLGQARFLTAGSLGSENALWPVSEDSVHPTYQGEKLLLEESIPRTGAKKLYIMLGMNDLYNNGPEGATANMEILLDRILENAPELEIYIQSMTPLSANSSILSSRLNNRVALEYNRALARLCGERGWHFVDVGSVMYDDRGFLREDYCSDSYDLGVHFTNDGCAAWVDYLLTHTAQDE